MFKNLFSDSAESGDGLYAALDLGRMLESHDGPAMVCDENGQLREGNAAASDLAVLLENAETGQALIERIRQCASEGKAITDRILTQLMGEKAVFQLTFLPMIANDGATLVVVAGRDVTVERNIIAALVESRELFKDLVDCSADLAYEADMDGMLSYVSPRGILGHDSDALQNQNANEIFDQDHEEETSPFSGDKDHQDQEFALRDASGDRAWVRISSRIVRDQDGARIGTRGVMRDITGEKERERHLERARLRDKTLSMLVDAIRNEVEPKRMLERAAVLPANALQAMASWVFRFNGEKLTLAARFPGETLPDQEEAVKAARKAAVVRDDAPPVTAVYDGKMMVAIATRYRGIPNGVICLLQDKSWSDEDYQLVERLADQLGIALQQLWEHERLETISRADALTGLHNRRAFMQDVHERLQHHRRHERPAAMMYLDLDNFKPVNDELGHKAGDELLKRFANLVEKGKRPGDITARLGGDEFAIWLEETDEEGAYARGKRLLQGLAPIAARLPKRLPPLSVSIGVAVVNPRAEDSLELLLERADKAMYQAKKSGKNGIYVDPWI